MFAKVPLPSLQTATWPELARLSHAVQLRVARAELLTIPDLARTGPPTERPTVYLGDLVDNPNVLVAVEATAPGTTEAMRQLVDEQLAVRLGDFPAYLLDAPDNDLPPRDAKAADLTKWATAHACRPLLDMRWPGLPGINTAQGTARYPWDATVGQLLTLKPPSGMLQSKTIQQERWVRAWLDGEASWQRLARAWPHLHAQALAQPGTAEAVTDFIGRLWNWRTARVKRTTPMVPERWGRIEVQDARQRRRLVLSVHFPPWCGGTAKSVTIEDEREDPESLQRRLPGLLDVQWHCTAHGADACPVPLAVVDQLLVLLAAAMPGSEMEAIAVRMSSPVWREALNALAGPQPGARPDPEVMPRQTTTKPLAEGQLRWKLTLDNSGQPDAVELVIQTPNKKTGFKTTKVPPARLIEVANERGTPQDVALAELAYTRSLVSRYSYGNSGAIWQAFWRHLVALPALLVGNDAEPFVMRRQAARLAVTPRDGDEIQVQLASDAGLFEWRDLPTVIAPEGWLLVRALANRTFWVLDLAASARPILTQLRRCDGKFPQAALDQVLRAISANPELPVDLHRDLSGEEVGHLTSWRAELRPVGEAGVGIALRLRLKALDGLSWQSEWLVPGQGVPQISAFVDGARVWTARDLPHEAQHAERLGLLLDLTDLEANQAFATQVLETDRAADLLLALADPDLGLEAHWPESARPRVVKKADSNALGLQLRPGREWFTVGGGVTIDGLHVPVDRLLEVLRGGRRTVRLDADTLIHLSESLRKTLGPLLDVAHAGRHGLEVGLVHAAALADLGPGADVPKTWLAMRERVREAGQLRPVQPPGLTAKLRPYQNEGMAWLQRMAHWAPGAVLADDMGLGKTVQALTILLHRQALGPALVVAPLTLASNWQNEQARFAPGLEIRWLRAMSDADLQNLQPGQVVWASWDLMARRIEALAPIAWATLVLDEAQAAKNPSTKRAQAVYQVKAGFRLALSGTPVENRISELWSLMRATVPGLLGSWESFRERFGVAIEAHSDKEASQRLARVIRPFLLRRTKREVAQDLPEKTEITLEVELSPGERALYAEHRAAILHALNSPDSPISPEQRRFMVLQGLTRLRQLACHPQLIDAETQLASAKLTVLLERLLELHAEGHRALVFSQFTRHLGLVRAALERAGLTCGYLDGQMTEKDRHAAVQAFQAGRGDVFLLSLKAGGVGLNLTSASYVFLLDPWWNPAVEDQAADRTHRIGQTRPVTIYRLVAKQTVEEAILALQAEKRELVDQLLDGTGAASKMGDAELLAVLLDPGQ